jgi:hypothetical protein
MRAQAQFGSPEMGSLRAFPQAFGSVAMPNGIEGASDAKCSRVIRRIRPPNAVEAR